MRAGEGKRPCREAEIYYYDFLCPDEATIPESARRHIAACPACQERIRRLRDTLFAAQRHPNPADTWDGKTIEELAVQFQLLDEHVACRDVKCFLPRLALALPQIRIPTPVTVHVDHCPQCAEDLAALRELNLTDPQLKRLSRFFETGRDEDVSPGQSQCQAQLRGQDICAAVSCADISTADLFDCAVPFGVTPDERHRAVATHVAVCPACTAKVRTLHHTIHQMLERADSDTTTVYHAQSDAEAADSRTAGTRPYPIEVQVLYGESGGAAEPGDLEMAGAPCAPELGPSAGAFQGHRHGPSHWELLARAAVVALALAALPAFWWIHPSTASGTDVNDVIKALAKVQSIRVVKTDHNAGPVQEFLIARRSNMLAMKTKQQCVVYDFERRHVRTVGPKGEIGPPTKLSRAQYDWANNFMANCLRDVLARVSPDAKLHRSAGELGTETGENLDVYEATWAARAGDSSQHNGWRIYIDPATALPQRTEFYRKKPGDTQWELITTTVFTYPTDPEMDRSIQALFPAK
jgi:hypothetical protein